MAGIGIDDNTSDPSGAAVVAHALSVNSPANSAIAGFVTLACESDSGAVIGTRTVRPIDISRDYRMRTSIDSILFNTKFPGSAISTQLWNQIASTMTIVVTGGFCAINSSASVAISTYAQIRTYKQFPMFGTFGLWAQASVQFSQLPVVGNVSEVGLFLAAANSAPTDGVFMRYTSAGTAVFVINFNGSETVSAVIANIATLFPVNTTHKFVIGIFDQVSELWIDDVLITSLTMPPGQGDITSSAELPFAFRTYNTTATTLAQIISVGTVNVTLADVNAIKLWSHTLAGLGGMGYEGQPGATIGSTALYSNSLSSGAGAAATNTTAAVGSGLGGQFALQPTLAQGTDGIISSYQVPAGTSVIPGKALYITGVKIEGVVTTAFTGGPCLFAWSLAYGHTSVSLATTEAAGAKAPRRVPLGVQVFAVTSAVGVRDDRTVLVKFDTPIMVQPGEFVQAVAKNLGTVTSAGVVVFLITFDSYWE